MTKQVGIEPDGKKNIPHVLFLSALLVLPGAIWALLGWVSGFLPLTAFVFINKFGWSYTNRQFAIAILASSFVSFFLHSLELTLFCAMLIPAGYTVALSAQRKDEPWLAGLKGILTLTICLTIFFVLLFAKSEISLFTALAESLNGAIEEVQRHYRDSGTLSSENYVILERSLYQMKTVAPMVIPAILGSLIIFISWITLVFGNMLLQKLECSQPWPEYRYWSLPDKLIWGLIISGIFALLPGDLTQLIGINILILLGLLYCFQGLAILVFLLNKWNIPRILRSIIYIMMVLQSFGTIILLGVGIANVWYDMRRHSPSNGNDKEEKE